MKTAPCALHTGSFCSRPTRAYWLFVRATLHASGGGSAAGPLGPVVMRAEIFETVTNPTCRWDNYACRVPFRGEGKGHARSRGDALVDPLHQQVHPLGAVRENPAECDRHLSRGQRGAGVDAGRG